MATVSHVLRQSCSASAVIAGVFLAVRAMTAPAESGAQGSATPVNTAADDVQVGIKEHKFGPDTATVSVGTRVTWVNHDDDLHTATSKIGVFASPGLETNEGFSYTFNAPGTYEYFCAVHPDMIARIIVK